VGAARDRTTSGAGVDSNKHMSRLITYFKETQAELKHVTWPTRKQAILYTVVVIVISLATSAYLGFFDYVFSTVLKLVI